MLAEPDKKMLFAKFFELFQLTKIVECIQQAQVAQICCDTESQLNWWSGGFSFDFQLTT
jgi:hypothetical protein